MYIRDSHASFPARFPPRDNVYISREIARRDLNPRAASFGKTFTPLDRSYPLVENWKGNKEIPENSSMFIESPCAETAANVDHTRTRISRSIPERLPPGIVGAGILFARESLKMIGTWIMRCTSSHATDTFAVANLYWVRQSFRFLDSSLQPLLATVFSDEHATVKSRFIRQSVYYGLD